MFLSLNRYDSFAFVFSFIQQSRIELFSLSLKQHLFIPHTSLSSSVRDVTSSFDTRPRIQKWTERKMKVPYSGALVCLVIGARGKMILWILGLSLCFYSAFLSFTDLLWAVLHKQSINTPSSRKRGTPNMWKSMCVKPAVSYSYNPAVLFTISVLI